MNRPKGLYVLDKEAFELIYGPEEQRDIAELVDVFAPPQTKISVAANTRLLAEADVILSGWGAPVMDGRFLEAAPRLRAVFYGSGSIRYFTTDALWRRNVLVTSSYAANAVPVAEYTLGVILLSLKHFWRLAAQARRGGEWRDPARQQVPGAFRRTVGLVSLGMIGQLVRERLQPFDLRVIAYDPLLTAEMSAALKVDPVPLQQLFREADVVSLHTPWLRETEGLIRGAHLAAMKTGATFINTARGAIVREREMIDALRQRPDLTAVLDVTDPEPPAAGSPLRTLPNVVLTPHIAGSLGLECRRMGRYVVEELRRYLAGEPLRWQLTEEKARIMA